MHRYEEKPPSVAARLALLGIVALIGVAMIWAVDRRAVQVAAELTDVEPAPEEVKQTYQQIVATGNDEEILTLLDELGEKDPTALSDAWLLAFDPANIDQERSMRLLREKFRQTNDRVVRGKIAAIAGQIGGGDAERLLAWIVSIQNDPDVQGNAIDAIGRQPASRDLLRSLRRFKGDSRTPQYVYLSASLYSLGNMAEQTFRRMRAELELASDDADWRW